jgi:hypothetical protein
MTTTRGHRRVEARRNARGVVLAVLIASLAGAAAASADLAPATHAPVLARRVCVHYRVVSTPAGTHAQCGAYRTDTLRTRAVGSPAGRRAHVSPTPSRTAPAAQSASQRRRARATRQRSQSPAARPALVRVRAANAAASRMSPSGVSLGVALAIIAAGVAAGSALLALVRVHPRRLPKGHARETAS